MRRSDGADVAAPGGARRLQVSDLVVDRRDTGPSTGVILDGIELALAPGKTAAVTGPSGAGKTTLLHVIAGLARPDRGSVRWGDVEIAALSEGARDRWRRDTVGLVFQDFHLIPELGVLDNILLPLSFDRWRTPAPMRALAGDLARRVGLGDRRTTRAGALSRGEQQRAAVARALIRRPTLLLADEPTASLDPDNGKRIADLLLSVAAEAGASLLVVSHDHALLDRVERIFRLDAGRLTRVDGSGR
jgi:putative ABC transport system ATP-binding protein